MMTLKSTILNAARSLALVLAAAWPLEAQREQMVPDTTVVTASGAPASLTSLMTPGKWVIFYLGSPTSAAAARLLNAMSTWEVNEGLTRVIVVIAAASDAQAPVDRWARSLPGVQWVADPANALAQALDIRGTPTLLGVEENRVRWKVAGVLNDPTMVRDVVKSWVAMP
jgi:hypothetical protein